MHFVNSITIFLLVVALTSHVLSKKHRHKKKEWSKSACECGTASSTSISGREINGRYSSKYLWVVNLMDKNNLTTFCVGTIISRSLILTSASCLLKTQEYGEENKCSANSRDLEESCFKSRSDIAIGFPIITETYGIFSRGGVVIKKIMFYSHATENGSEEGLVLLRMFPAFECKDIPPVCLGNHKLVKNWTAGILSGWKTDNFKNGGENMTRSDEELATLNNVNCSKIQGYRAFKQAVMCPLQNESASYCKGYAGAPVVVRMKHRLHLVGVMSKAIINDNCEKHDIFPMICIQNYLTWIHKHLKKEGNIYFDRRSSHHVH